MSALPERRYPSDRSLRAAQLVAEGRIGGREIGKKGGRPRKPRAGELVAEAARENADQIIAAFEAGIAEGVPPSTRATVAEKWLKIEACEAQLQLDEHRQEVEQLDRETMIKLLADKLTGDSLAGRLVRDEVLRRKHLKQEIVVDGEAADLRAENL